ncbi:calcium/sodium antiporter [Candidatus Woesearchaeota archaeon]|nr:MAG: inner membrane protein [archaeon GW2011_AR4]MBS3130417.1 calcium/sodium antiporter [Candidatus Woesearchaeota archaeon]HIH38680.1 calcium/sodium antiporter [Candidatus Woesearchaeota archaeon]HIH49614.1 calcium/sodium antiporter [Candidatus Woesearchaeota archaeon]HIJ03526.1 calcium/sodium antiporter [Candidatus Woesearchaeota archaeon]
MIPWLLFILGFFLVVKGADYLVDGASSLAKKLKVSDLVIGLTIVAFGTSLPELVVNVFSSAQGSSEIAIGTVLGSNIFNILVILGLAAIIYPLKVTKSTVWKEIPFSLLAVVLVGVMANDMILDGAGASSLTRIDGIVLLSFFFIFLVYVFEAIKKQETANTEAELSRIMPTSKSILSILGGLLLLVLGGRYTVDGAIGIATALGVSQALIGLTIVAAGTSLPELATSLVAARKKNTDIAIGNIVGSNIFNVFFILGISSLIRPLPFRPADNLDILVTILATIALFSAMFTGEKEHKLEKWEGMLFIAAYIGYIIFLIMRG